MEQRTKIKAESGGQDLMITREFDLPVDMLFEAYIEPELVEAWMGTKVIKLESKKHGSYHIQTSNPEGQVVFQADGVIHELVPNTKIIRTFEMLGTPFGVQLELLQFEALGDETSKLTMHVVYESGAQRDQVLQMGYVQGINMAHNRLQEVVHSSR